MVSLLAPVWRSVHVDHGHHGGDCHDWDVPTGREMFVDRPDTLGWNGTMSQRRHCHRQRGGHGRRRRGLADRCQVAGPDRRGRMAGLFVMSSAKVLKQSLAELRSGQISGESLLEYRH
jgi:hypothetical protein